MLFGSNRCQLVLNPPQPIQHCVQRLFGELDTDSGGHLQIHGSLTAPVNLHVQRHPYTSLCIYHLDTPSSAAGR